jgi:RNA ligase
LDSDAPFDLVPVYGDISSIDDYIAKVRGQEEREGDVIHFSDGHKVKIKTDWYVRIHKILDKVKFERNIVDLILNDELDDAIAGLPESERERIKNYEKKFWQKFNQKIEDLKSIYEKSQKYETRKEIALNYANDLEKSDKSLLFKMLDGRDVHSLLLKHIQNNTSTNAKWEICESWLNIS